MGKRKVQIVQLPKAQTGQQVGYSLYNRLATMGGLSDTRPRNNLSVSRTIGGVPREEANLEAEGGETVMIPELYGNIPTHFTISGPRHAQGGVPMNLPENSFIFSDYVNMKIKDPDVLNYFGKTAKKGGKVKGYTPADIAKQYDINKYIKILQDPNSDDIDRKTAEMMIKNYNLKLGALGLVQEAQKGFETGVPEVSEPFMDHVGITPADLGVVSDEAKELAQVIQQMLEQGVQLEEVLVQLITEEVAPDVILEALTVIGMSEEEAGQLIEGVITELMSAQQQPQPINQESPNPEMPLGPIDPQQTQEIMNMSEQPMTPEMMLCGGKVPRKLKRQMGGPGPEMMGQEQMIQPGMEQMGQANPEQEVAQQVMMAVEQMMQEGMELNQIVFELLNMDVPEEIIAQVLMQAGISEPELQEAFEIAMSHPQMGGGQDMMMDPNMQGMSPDMMPEMDPAMGMMQMGGMPQMMPQPGMGQGTTIEDLIIQALQKGATREQIIKVLEQQELEDAEQRVDFVIQQLQGMQQPQFGMQPQMKKGGAIKRYDEGGTVPEKYRTDSRYDKRSKDFTYAGLKKGDYIKIGDDKFIQLHVDFPDDFELPSAEAYAGGGRENVEEALLQLAYFKELSKNSKLKEAFHEAYMESIKDENLFKDKNAGKTSTFFGDENLESVTPEQLIELYTKHIETNASLYLKGLDPNHFNQNGTLDLDNKEKRKNFKTLTSEEKQKYKKLYNDLGGTTLQKIYDKQGLKSQGIDIAKSQAAQWAYKKIQTKPEKYIKDPELLETTKTILARNPSFGVRDEKGTGFTDEAISPIDGWLGNTTIGHAGTVSLYSDPIDYVPPKPLADPEDPEDPEDEQIQTRRPPAVVPIGMSPQEQASLHFALGMGYLPSQMHAMPDFNVEDPSAYLIDHEGMTHKGLSAHKQSADQIAAMNTNAGVTRANLLGLQSNYVPNITSNIENVYKHNQATKQAVSSQSAQRNQINAARNNAWLDYIKGINQETSDRFGARQHSINQALNVLGQYRDRQAKDVALMTANPQVGIDYNTGFIYMHNPLDIVTEQPNDGSDVANVYNTFFQKTGDKALAKDLTELHFGKGHYAKDRQVRPGDANRQAAQDYMQAYSQRGGSIGVYGANVFPFMFY